MVDIIPEQLKNPSFKYNLLKPRDKIPFETSWQEKGYIYSDEKLQKHITSGGNYGIIGGHGRLRLLDIDVPELAIEIQKVLNTFTVKTGKGGRHFYILSDYEHNHVLGGEKGELRASNQFVVCPGCIHPNGNKYKIINDTPILELSGEELSNILKPFFKLEKTDYKKMLEGQAEPGERNDGYFRTACLMRFQGIPKENADAIIETANQKNTKPIGKEELKRIIDNAYGYKNTNKTKESQKFVVNYSGFNIKNTKDNVEHFHTKQPFFYDKSKIYWFWNIKEHKWQIVDETDVMSLLDDLLKFNGQTTTSRIKSEYLEQIKRTGRKKAPEEAKIHWVQFKDKAFSLTSKQTYKVTPKYFFTNPIPWEIGETNETPVIDKLIDSWVGSNYRETMYEIISYCCYRNYPIQLLFSLCGSGRNGKSQFMKILDKFIGDDNCTTTELDLLLENRFESFKLYKKLVCTIGETNFGILDKSSILKKLTGGDKIGYEKKNKDPFDDYNYAKPIIASNSLPSSNDTSDGFYRRWLIIDFPNEFEESGKDIVETISEIEYNNLAKRVTETLPKLLNYGKFTNQGSIKQRKEKYIEMSNPLSTFIKKYCELDFDECILYSRLYTHYLKFLSYHKKRRVKMKEFKNALEDEGLFVEKDTIQLYDGMYKSGYYVKGIKVLDKIDNLDNDSTQQPIYRDLSGIGV